MNFIPRHLEHGLSDSRMPAEAATKRKETEYECVSCCEWRDSEHIAEWRSELHVCESDYCANWAILRLKEMRELIAKLPKIPSDAIRMYPEFGDRLKSYNATIQSAELAIAIEERY